MVIASPSSARIQEREREKERERVLTLKLSVKLDYLDLNRVGGAVCYGGEEQRESIK